MIIVWLIIAVLQAMHVPEAVAAWAWFGHHVLLTVLMLIFLA